MDSFTVMTAPASLSDSANSVIITERTKKSMVRRVSNCSKCVGHNMQTSPPDISVINMAFDTIYVNRVLMPELFI